MPIQIFLRRIVVNMQIGTMYGNTETAAMLAMGRVHSQNIQMSMIIITLLPILFVYPFVQKHFMKGVLIGAIKG
jgi:putative aldouronate transport system permease protein